MDYLETNQILIQSQHGFRKKKSTLTNLIEFYDEVTKELDLGNKVDVAYLDFQKAFDKVSHFKLIIELRNIRIGSELLKWISGWLTDRKQNCNKWKLFPMELDLQWDPSGISFGTLAVSYFH